MSETFSRLATDPRQYDYGDVDWASEGAKQHYTRRMILEGMLPCIGDVEGKRVLDIGSGLGWLCGELTGRGASTVGIEPSIKNIQSAKEQFPELDFRHTPLEDFGVSEEFDEVVASMVFEHLGNLKDSFDKINSLLSRMGRLVIVSGDFNRLTTPRPGVEVDTEIISKEVIATCSNYGERAGILYDIFRSPDYFMSEAELSGFKTIFNRPICIPDWLRIEVPRYRSFSDEPVFQVFGFELEK